MLLEQPGEVVLREEIRQRLWPNNTVVEFDHGINAAIQKLRDALGESAGTPRYVETVARRGYRFLGEAERIGEPPSEQNSEPETGVPGNVVAHYRLLDKLGEGGIAVESSGNVSHIGEERPVLGPISVQGDFDVSPDGQGFLVLQRSVQAQRRPLTVVESWTAALRTPQK